MAETNILSGNETPPLLETTCPKTQTEASHPDTPALEQQQKKIKTKSNRAQLASQKLTSSCLC